MRCAQDRSKIISWGEKAMPHQYFSIFIRLPYFLRILIIATAVIIGFGFIIFLIEPETFHTPFEGIWWAIVTAATVGYGDFVPKTTFGKVTGIVLMFFGIGFVSSYFAALATAAVTRQENYIEGKMKFKGEKHIIIVGWNERSKKIINKLLKSNLLCSVVLIDQTLKSNPLPDYHVHFIQGRANVDDVLIRANIFEADRVLITADQNMDELQADMNTILTLLSVKGLNPIVPCVVEILTTEQVANAKRAGADEVIQSNVITSSVMMNGLKSEGVAESFLSLLDLLNGSRIQYRSSQSFIGKSFLETNNALLEKGCLLLGIKRGEKTIVNPPQPFIIVEQDILLVISE